jgi:hypothetical protein
MAGILPECIVRVLAVRHNSQTISAHWQQPMHGCVGSYWSETQQPSVFSCDSFIRFPGWHRPTGFGEMAEALPPNVFSCGGWTALGCGARRVVPGSWHDGQILSAFALG